MNKLIVLFLLMAIVLMAGFSTPAHAQTPPSDLKPTFISPTPGLYVNGWPAFTVSYPKEWEEIPAFVGGFSARVRRQDLPPGPHLSTVTIGFDPDPLPIEDWAKSMMPVYLQMGTDIKVLSDKPSRLKDGTPAREGEVELVLGSGPWALEKGTKLNDFVLVTKKELIWVVIHVAAINLPEDRGQIGVDVKRVVYSLTFLRGREEPVKVPPDVQAFLDMFCVDMAGHDVKAIMGHFSDRFRSSGASKGVIEQWWRNDPNSPIHKGVISEEATVTVFESRGDKAYLDGFYLEKIKGEADSR